LPPTGTLPKTDTRNLAGGPTTELAINVLYYGDNLDILRRYLPDASVDLTYLDPPFNSTPRLDGTTNGVRT
jgi:hypothetical protein